MIDPLPSKDYKKLWEQSEQEVNELRHQNWDLKLQIHQLETQFRELQPPRFSTPHSEVDTHEAHLFSFCEDQKHNPKLAHTVYPGRQSNSQESHSNKLDDASDVSCFDEPIKHLKFQWLERQSPRESDIYVNCYSETPFNATTNRKRVNSYTVEDSVYLMPQHHFNRSESLKVTSLVPSSPEMSKITHKLCECLEKCTQIKKIRIKRSRTHANYNKLQDLFSRLESEFYSMLNKCRVYEQAINECYKLLNPLLPEENKLIVDFSSQDCVQDLMTSILAEIETHNSKRHDFEMVRNNMEGEVKLLKREEDRACKKLAKITGLDSKNLIEQCNYLLRKNNEKDSLLVRDNSPSLSDDTSKNDEKEVFIEIKAKGAPGLVKKLSIVQVGELLQEKQERIEQLHTSLNVNNALIEAQEQELFQFKEKLLTIAGTSDTDLKLLSANIDYSKKNSCSGCMRANSASTETPSPTARPGESSFNKKQAKIEQAQRDGKKVRLQMPYSNGHFMMVLERMRPAAPKSNPESSKNIVEYPEASTHSQREVPSSPLSPGYLTNAPRTSF